MKSANNSKDMIIKDRVSFHVNLSKTKKIKNIPKHIRESKKLSLFNHKLHLITSFYAEMNASHSKLIVS